MTKQPWYDDEELEKIEREDQLLEAKANVEHWRANPRYTSAMLEGRV